LGISIQTSHKISKQFAYKQASIHCDKNFIVIPWSIL